MAKSKANSADKKEPDKKEVEEKKVDEEKELKAINVEIKRNRFIETADKLKQELEQGYRMVEYDGKEYYIHFPTIKDEEEIIKQKTRMTGLFLKEEDMLTSSEIMDQLKKRHIWTNEHERKEARFDEEIGEVTGRMFAEYAKDEPDSMKILDYKLERDRLAKEKEKITAIKNMWLISSLDNAIDTLVTKIKLFICVKDKNGNRIWNSIDDLDNEKDKALVTRLNIDAQYFWAGWHPDMLD